MNAPKRRIKYTRQADIMDRAAEIRRANANEEAAIDIGRLLEFGLRNFVSRYDWIVGTDDHFALVQDAEAYVDFSETPRLVLREHVYDALYDPSCAGFHQARFVVAHEIGHLALHSQSRKTLARKKLSSSTQYSENPKLESEANVFAGSLLVPTTGLAQHLDANTIALRYMTSQKAAEFCAKECGEYAMLVRLKRRHQ